MRAEVQKLLAAGHKAIAVRCDMSDDAQVAAMVDRTVAEFGRLDAAFNNAGVMPRIAPTAESTLEEWERVKSSACTGATQRHSRRTNKDKETNHARNYALRPTRHSL